MVWGTSNQSFPVGLLRSAREGSNPRGQMETHGGEGPWHSEPSQGFSGAQAGVLAKVANGSRSCRWAELPRLPPPPPT